MLILEDTKHNKIAPLPNAKDVKIERDLSGNDTLSFSYAMGIDDFYSSILPQCFIVTPDQEYVIKEVNPGEENYVDVVAVVNTEDLKSLYNNAFTRTDVKLSEIATNALVGSGWTFQSDVTKLRSLSMTNSTALDILKKLAETYMCDINFDAKNKIVTFKDTIGSETEGQGVYFIDKLNLVGLEVQSNTYDFCTRLIPVGQDNLYITDVNAGLPYVENYQYCNQIVVAYWDASQYTDKNALKADAIEKLKVLSTPTVAYKANVRDLANLMPNQYKFLNYKLGDFVRIRDNQKQIEENVRIVKTADYPFEPENNQVELNSRYEQLEDIELKHEQTDNTVSSITTPDGGGINGDTVDKIDWTKVQNVQVQTAQIEDAAITNAKIANATITSAQIQDATIITAKIGDLQVTNEKVANLSADKIAAGTIDANKINVINIDASQISTGFLNADRILAGSLDANKIKTHSITADSAIIADAAINTAQIADLSVTNAKIANATITGAKIDVATIDTANIKNAAITTALIDVGAVNTQQVADGSITDAKIVSLTANKITAGTIDAGVINVVNLNADNITVGTINGQHITDNTIGNDKIEDGAIDNSKIQDGASINGAKLDIATVFDVMNSSAELDLYGSGCYGETAYGGRNVALHDDKVLVVQDGKSLDLVLSNVGERLDFAELKIQPNSIISTVISSDEFTEKSSQIAQTAENIKIGFNGIDNNVVFDENGLHVNHGSIDGKLANITNLNADNINTGQLLGKYIASQTITTDKLVSGAITSDKIASHTITANEIATNTITSAQMATGTITASSGIISSIDASKITTGTLSGDRIYGGTITGALLKTSNTSNYMYLHDQYIDFYKNGSKMAVIGYDQSADNQYLYPKLSLFNNGNEYIVGMYRDNKLWSNINYFPFDVTFNGGVNAYSVSATDNITSYNNISAMYNIEAINGTITAGSGFSGLGKKPAYSKSVSISNGSNEDIYHYLGYYPIVVLSGTIGNIILTYVHQSSSCLRVHCYSGGGATWNGIVYLY
ncbi:phage tail protein [Clostridium tyrobutyricum]|uniref:phage tail spike protein n=1 Tax=Clostridium tyrobutyricum TaxID=1519 RepID=UPI001C3956E3|nr:phage tail spike protein [Clostridium tyrobutyricum]MBV4445302.1 phage tail protein [Clostridium tyrobutyricum]MBV4445493.1 phage tail protein [Clostridium tyrobutyricum]